MIKVSKVTKRQCAGTVQSQGGRVRNVKQVGFETRPEDSYGRCRRDMIRETVPDTSSGDRKSSVTDGRQSGAADNQWRRWTGTESPTSLDICHLTKLVDEVSRCRPVETLVHKDCMFECNPLWSLQTVQLMQERSNVLELWWRKNKPSSGVLFITDYSLTRDVMKRRPVSHCHSPAG